MSGRYIMGETWFWMSGQSMEFTHWPPHFVPHQESAPCGSMDVDELHRWADRSCDQHLHFVCQSGERRRLTSHAFPCVAPHRHVFVTCRRRDRVGEGPLPQLRLTQASKRVRGYVFKQQGYFIAFSMNIFKDTFVWGWDSVLI